MNRINIFLWWCAGVNINVLKKYPSDYAKHFGVGGTVLFTALMASLAGGYAFSMVFNNVFLSICFGLFWGLLIFNLDRYIVSTVGSINSKSALEKSYVVVPRLLIAIVLGIVISTPLELKLFEKAINTEIKEHSIEINQALKAKKTYETSRIYELESKISKSEQKIDILKTEIQKALDDKDSKSKIAIEEWEGKSGTGRFGDGPVYRRKQKDFEESRAIYEQKKINNDSLIQKQYKYINDYRAEIEKEKALKSQSEKEYASVVNDDVGFLARIEALSRLSKKRSATRITSFLISLLFILIETSPVLFKIITKPSEYEMEIESLKHLTDVVQKKQISDINDEINTDIKISTEKNKTRLEAELKGSDDLLNHIAIAQAEIAKIAVDKWRVSEINKLKEDGKNGMVNGNKKDSVNIKSVQ